MAHFAKLDENNVVIRTIGDFNGLPLSCQQELSDAYQRTKDNTGVHLILALNYSSRWELVNAVKQIAGDVKSGELNIEDIDEATINSHLTTSDIPEPELLIRTSGEHRISNFLLWQLAYAELYFTDVLWPDFDSDELQRALADYQSRKRRFGLTDLE